MNKDIYPIYQEALSWAIPKHGNQMYGDKPYEFHLRQVCALLDHANWDGSIDRDQFIAGACHDLLEDTNVTLQELAERYGERVSFIVWCCTGEGSNRKAKQASIVKKLLRFPFAVVDKMADRVSNMRNCVETKNFSLLKMYQKEFDLYDPIFKKDNKILYAEFVSLSNYKWE